MIITCSQCSTQYYLTHKALAPHGKKLKCSKCASIWFQDYIEPPKVTFDNHETNLSNTQTNKVFLPAIVKKKHPIWSLTFIVILLFTALGSTTLFFQEKLTTQYPYISKFYDKLGIPSINDIRIHNIEISNRKNDQIDINAVIKNNSKTYRRVPSITISLFDNNNILLKRIFIPSPPKYLNTKSKYAFYRRVKNDSQTKPKVISIALATGIEKFFHYLEF
ncbi:MAG: zinc-ribbon domain-containing protein [Rickettsiales bacterium]|nr:zinc-ribbon domain-containing protein [Rickettsiales bacterium]